MRLSDFIVGNMEPILLEWECFAREIQPVKDAMDVLALRDHAEDMLATIATDLASPQSEQESIEKSRGQAPKSKRETAAETHAEERLRAGFSIDLLVSEYRALRSSVLRLWLKGDDDEACAIQVEDMIRFNEAIDQALAASVARYSDAASQSRDIFLGIVGHDLRSPLQSISLGAEFLMRCENVEGRLIQLGSRMFNSASRMNEMLNNLLDFTQSRIGGGIKISPAKTNLQDIAEQVVEEFRSSNPGRNIRSEVEGDCWAVVDGSRIGQVYQNLVGNALQYGKADSDITVLTRATEREVVLSVHNDGNAIPAEEQLRIFDLLRHIKNAPGQSSRAKNLGLGLYIAREIIAAHQGHITVVSEEEEGTTFTVLLPRS